MTLNTALKNWIASNAGAGNCYTSSGVSFIDPDGISRTGGSGDVLNAFFVAHLLGKDTNAIIVSTNYNTLKTINGGADVSLDDVTWIYNNDGTPAGEARYCSGITPTPTSTTTPGPTPTSIPAGPQVFEFVGSPTGNPVITLNLSEMEMSQSGIDRHFQMNNVKITNNSSWPVYLIAELRIFTGLQTICPVSGQVFTGLNRTETTTRSVRVNMIDPGIAELINLDFFQPGSIIGLHTVCLYIHGSFYRQSVIDEVVTILT